MTRKVNNYQIETLGGFITIKHWIITDKDNNYMGTYFKFGDAKTACLNNNFTDAYQGSMY